MWGLDDYQFLPFIWGSAQLVGHPVVRPRSIHNHELLKSYAGEYMYLAAVEFVKKVGVVVGDRSGAGRGGGVFAWTGG